MPPPQAVFYSQSSCSVLLFLRAFSDLEKVRRGDGYPLLHLCIYKDIANEEVISELKEQVEAKWGSWSPIRLGEENGYY
jgi:hypothetical protein